LGDVITVGAPAGAVDGAKPESNGSNRMGSPADRSDAA